jgi:hypothetical protein
MKKNLMNAALALTCVLVKNNVFSMQIMTSSYRYPVYSAVMAKKELMTEGAAWQYHFSEIEQTFSQENWDWFSKSQYVTENVFSSVIEPVVQRILGGRYLIGAAFIHALGKFYINDKRGYYNFSNMAQALGIYDDHIIHQISATAVAKAERRTIDLIGQDEYKKIKDFISQDKSFRVNDIHVLKSSLEKRAQLKEDTLIKLGIQEESVNDNFKTLMRALNKTVESQTYKTPEDLVEDLGITPDLAANLGILSPDQILGDQRAQLEETQHALETEKLQLQQKLQEEKAKSEKLNREIRNLESGRKQLEERDKLRLQQESQEKENKSKKLAVEKQEIEQQKRLLEEKSREIERLRDELTKTQEERKETAETFQSTEKEKQEIQENLSKIKREIESMPLQNATKTSSMFVEAFSTVFSEKFTSLTERFLRDSQPNQQLAERSIEEELDS